MSPEQEIARGDQARTLYEHPLMQEALATLRNSVRDSFFDLPAGAGEQREFLHLMDRARQQFERVFEFLIKGADVARNELREEEHSAARLEAINRRTLNG